ncbi:glycosyltransferase family 4 protein [Flavobacterium piscinae]|nr:glycosyltransferase [Flavobacterium piscinae]MBC8883187.1 glycosyltransferase family 4 protein [Flavobacterium piscinae]
MFWVKYAGDWGQIKPPLANRIQRYWLKKNWAKCKVTINGFWNNQPNHCYSFENPCLSEEDVSYGKTIALEKVFQKPYNFCFVGRVNDAKGVSDIISSFKNVPLDEIKNIHIIGDGDEIDKYKRDAEYLNGKIIFHGFQDKEYVHLILKSIHFFLLPSKAEGFPKVVAEAACYGGIPIVSNVGSIAHYINDQNGFVWNIKNKKCTYDKFFNIVLETDQDKLKLMSNNVVKLAEMFTFDNYLKKIEQHILN